MVDRIEAPPATPLDGRADVILDLVGDDHAPPRGVHLALRCGGLPVLDGAVAAILDDRLPVLEASLSVDGVARPFARWPVAIEDRRSALRSATLILGRAAHLAVAAVEALLAAADPAEATLHLAEVPVTAPARPGIGLEFFASALAAKIAARLSRLAGRRPPTWATAWRRRAGGGDPFRPDRDPTPFRRLPEDGARFFADPFLFTEGGRLHLFVEEFPFATGKGVISHAVLGPDGDFGPPTPVLEMDCHLSYPFVFAHDGHIFMIPETSGRRTVELWVAERFPDRWVRHSILLDDVDVGDATIVEIDGTWWMFGATRAESTSSWEALSLWSAPSPYGPWRRHAHDPAIVDVRAARPAGHVFRSAEGWCRPVQDSARGYGSGLAVARIDELTPTTHRETVIRRFATPPPLLGLHTWNRASLGDDLFEVIDVFADLTAFGDTRPLDLADTDGR